MRMEDFYLEVIWNGDKPLFPVKISANRDILVIENIKNGLKYIYTNEPVNFHQDYFDHCSCSQFHHDPDKQNDEIEGNRDILVIENIKKGLIYIYKTNP